MPGLLGVGLGRRKHSPHDRLSSAPGVLISTTFLCPARDDPILTRYPVVELPRDLKGTAMVRAMLLCAMLFQGVPQTPLQAAIVNDRVIVWDVTGPITAQPFDSVVVSLSGKAAFLPKATPPNVTGRSIVIDLKDQPVVPLANTSGYPLAFPRPGSKKILENERLIVWDYTWTPGVPTPMHFHDKDVVVVFLDDGDLSSTTPDGKVTVNSFKAGMVRFNPRNRTHTETLVRGKQRAIITELK
jgi:hypothetical protein